jgi:hypothetical protein
MAAGLGSELFTLATSFDPYGAYKEGARQPAQEEIKDIATTEALKDARAEQSQSLGQMTGQPQTGGLGGMAKSMLPPTYKLATDDGIPTASGLFNQQAMNSQQDLAASAKMVKEANLARAMGDTKNYANLMSEARRLQTTATQNMGNAKKEYQKSMDDALESVYNANSQTDYDQRVKDALARTGIPMPQGIPENWSPDIKQKVLSMMSPEASTKIEKEDRARRDEARKEKSAELRDRRLEALLRDGQGGAPSKTYDTLEEKVNDPSYGVAKGKIPAKEQTVARRITTDSKEVTQGIDQVMTLTEGGMRNTTGTTFANVKDTGLLTAPAKFFTNKISDKDSAMYDAMMYPLVKGLSLYTNPDYRPTDNDVKIAMNAYKAQSGQSQAVQLEKMAELKKNYLSAAESFLDSNILNAQQANSLKQQIRYVEKAIPWDVKDVVNFTRQKDYKDFKGYLGARGELPSEKKEPSTTKTSAPQNVTTQEQYDALPSGAIYVEDGKTYKKP